MGRQKGTKKTGGRQKGTPNKVTKDLRGWVSDLIDSNREQIEKDLQELEPKERIQVFEKFLQYTLPKKQSVKTEIDFNTMTDEQLNDIINQITENIE